MASTILTVLLVAYLEQAFDPLLRAEGTPDDRPREQRAAVLETYRTVGGHATEKTTSSFEGKHERRWSAEGSSQKPQSTSISLTSLGKTSTKTLSVLFNKVRQLTLFHLQCNYAYKGVYQTFIDRVDILTLTSILPRQFQVVQNRTGYVLSLGYREQQTKASVNLFSLQCLAKALPVYVVEPFVQNSNLVIPLEVNNSNANMLRFRDVFDIVTWQSMASIKGLAPLAGWDRFLSEAPRPTIVVYFKYPKYESLMKQKDSGEKRTQLATDDRYTKGCSMSHELMQKIKFLSDTYSFQVVRKVCFNFEFGDALSLSQFNSHVYARLQPGEHTVVMEQWRGAYNIESGNRVTIQDACLIKTTVDPTLFTWPSYRLLCDADSYKQKYLKSDDYIALMVRTEKFKTKSVGTNISLIEKCLNKTLQVWWDLQASQNLTTTFVAMDVGTYGSRTLTSDRKYRHEYKPHLPLFERFFKEVYGPQFSIRKWESRFESVAHSHDSGYIGSLQRTLVSKASCVVFTGGGSFQKNAKYMYEKIHKKNQCVRIVNQCTGKIN